MTLLKAEDCRDVQNLTFISSFHVHMLNRTTQVVDANFSLPYDIDHSIEVSNAVYRKLTNNALFALLLAQS